MFTFFNKLSLQVKVIASTLFIVLIFGAAQIVLNTISRQQNVEHLEKSYVAYAKNFQSVIAAQFYERYGDVQAFAANPHLKNFDKSMEQSLNDYVKLYGIYDLIMVTDTKGNLLATNTVNYKGEAINTAALYKKNYAKEAWFEAVVTGKFTEDKAKGYSGTFVEQPQVDPYITGVYGDKVWANGFSAAIKNDVGEVIGVVTNRANFKWVENELINVAGNISSVMSGEYELMIVDKDGKALALYDNLHDKGVYHRDFTELGIANIYNNHIELKNITYKDAGITHAIDKNNDDSKQLIVYEPISDSKWIQDLGWSVMLHIEEGAAYAYLDAQTREFYIEFAIMLVIASILSVWFGKYLSKQFTAMASKLSETTDDLLKDSTSMATTSDQLSSAATEQAAALQETVSAIDEVSAMVSKNAENARKSKEISQDSEKSALQGKKSMEEMITVIDEIHKSNTEMMEQIKKSNEEFTNIVNVINEIGNKTKVINDIVFQTKLLSFNASVEAARAGAHGKGFAVVAEEVGNLAQMSGNAAKEISGLLDSSIVKVESIVSETKSRVDRLVEAGKEKVDAGIKTAKSCSEVLEEIVASVSQVNQMVEEIATASNEQAQGVSEITKAMNQLDQVTQQNTTAANVSSDTATEVKNKAELFKSVVSDLLGAVIGQGKKAYEAVQRKPESTNEKKVLNFKKKEKVAKLASTGLKKASGDDSVPAHDDKRFEEV